MPEIGTPGLMSGDGKRGVAEWLKLPRPSSTLPTETFAISSIDRHRLMGSRPLALRSGAAFESVKDLMKASAASRFSEAELIPAEKIV